MRCGKSTAATVDVTRRSRPARSSYKTAARSFSNKPLLTPL